MRGWLQRDPAFTWRRALALIGVLAAAGVLRGLELKDNGIGHAYYGATVFSMMKSPANFWYAAAEPGGSISVDKPPLGLMLQAASAWIFGFNWISLALPQLAAGMLSIAALHALIGRRFGFWAGMTAALALATTPVAAMLDRTNMLDSTLALTQIAGVGFGLQAATSGRLRPLLWAMVWFGLGFNIKMLQAVFALPGVVIAYLLGAPVPGGTRIRRLALAGMVYAAVALGWAAGVALTPAEQRPWIGSTLSNSVSELIFDYNGLARISGVAGVPDMSGGLAEFFREPLRVMTGGFFYGAGFVLPVALAGLAAIGATWRPRKRLAEPYLSALVWGTWLVAGVLVLSGARFIHSYYAIIYAVPAAALTGVVASQVLGQGGRQRAALWVALCGGVSAYALATATGDGYSPSWWAIPAAATVTAAGLLALKRTRAAVAAASAALFCGPLLFTGLTSVMPLDRTIPGPFGGVLTAERLAAHGEEGLDFNPEALKFLLANAVESAYLVAVPSAQLGAPYVLHSGRAVLYIGGFAGREAWIGVDGLRQMITSGRLRYVYLPVSLDIRRPELRAWATADCRLVAGVDLMPPEIRLVDGQRVYENIPPRGIDSLYDCAPAGN